MAKLQLVNPRRRKSRRSAAQRAATRKMLAANRARRRNPTRAANPKRRRARRRNPVAARVANPRRRRSVARAVRRVRRRRNPISVKGMLGNVQNLAINGAIGAGGALAVDLAMGYIPFPANLTARTNATGGVNWLYYATKTGLALAIGTFGRKLLGARAGTMAEGAMTVNLYDLFRAMMPAGVKLGYISPAVIANRNRIAGLVSQYTSPAASPRLATNAGRRVAGPAAHKMGQYVS